MTTLWRDLSFGVRLLARKPGFAAAVVLSLVLGIGLNTAIFTLLDSIFLRPIPVEDLDSLTVIYATRSNAAGEYVGFYSHSHPNYVDWVERNRSFSSLGMYVRNRMNFSGGSEPSRSTGIFATANYFEILGIQPAAGRFFLPEEDTTPGTHPVTVLSYGCWSRLFGQDDDVIGKQVEINGRSFQIIGVAPEGFKGLEVGFDADFWVPLMMFADISAYGSWFEFRGVGLFNAFGRLAEGVSIEQASAELGRIYQHLEEAFPEQNEGLRTRVEPLLEGAISPEDRSRHVGYGTILLIAVMLILLMSCLNVAGLLLVRGLERGRELAIRQSLGASRRRTIRQLISENFFLFFLGGALSLPVARLCLDLLWRFRPPQFAQDALNLELDWTLFGFALLTALVTGAIFGILPALRATRLNLVSHLKESVIPGQGGGMMRTWLQPRRVLVIGQVALALVSLIGAGMYLRSLQNAHRIDVGFDADSLLAVSFAPGEQGYDEVRARGFYDEVLERVEALPGVRAATLAENRLLRGGTIHQQVFLEGQTVAFEGGGRDFHRTNAIFPGFLETVGTPILRGRDFDSSISAEGPRVTIVNETFAELAWPGEDPIGKRFRLDFPDRPLVEVIGVAQDMKYRQIHEAPQCFLYFAEIQRHASAMTLHVRADGDPAKMLAAVRETVRELAPELPLADVGTLAQFVDEALWIERASAMLFSAFGALALGLAVVGVYGVLAEAVAQRRREMGVRMAIGADRFDVLRTVFRDGLKLVAIGVVCGTLATWMVMKLTTTVSSQLHGVDVTDPKIYFAAAVVLFLGALAGFLVPALRAAKTDPVSALRGE